MTEFEMAELLILWGEFLESTFERFIALLFAFLIAAYLVSTKLRTVVVVIVITLYSYVALRFAWFYLNIATDHIALAAAIAEARAQPGSTLAWLDVSPNMAAIHYLQTAAMVASYLASIGFFFYMRHHPPGETNASDGNGGLQHLLDDDGD